MTLQQLYLERCRTPHNIDQHLPVLRLYASECQHITELGTDIGFSTTAFLSAQPRVMHCYDIRRRAEWELLASLAGQTELVFHEEDTLTAVIEPTDLLFVDTEHTYAQVRDELWRHGHKAEKFLIFHDVVSCPEIVPAIRQYVAERPEWQLERWSEQQSGLAVYRRR